VLQIGGYSEYGLQVLRIDHLRENGRFVRSWNI
jgi:hypothetical protein